MTQWEATKLDHVLAVNSVMFKNEREENIGEHKGHLINTITVCIFSNVYMEFGTLASLNEFSLHHDDLF